MNKPLKSLLMRREMRSRYGIKEIKEAQLRPWPGLGSRRLSDIPNLLTDKRQKNLDLLIVQFFFLQVPHGCSVEQ